MVRMRVGPVLLAFLFVVVAALSAGQAAWAAPKDPCAVAAGSAPAPGESATNATPYDPSTVEASIATAGLRHANSSNHVTMEIPVRNRSGKPTCASYAVFLTFNRPGADPRDQPAGCQDQWYNDPDVPRGTYHCTVIIDGPGQWELTGTINQPGTQVNLTTVATTLDFPDAATLECPSCRPEYAIEGSAFEVFLLQFHVAAAGLWLLLAAAMAFLAVPRLRRTLSVLAVHVLEVRRGFLVSSLWGTFGATLGTGLYLLASQTAYSAPFSTNGFSLSAWDRLANLPYGQTYFLVLYGKILIFGVMAVASVVLMLEAARLAQIAAGAEDLEADELDDLWGRGVHFDEEGHVHRDDDAVVAGGAAGTMAGTAVRARSRSTALASASQRTLWACVAVLVMGALAIGGAVTGLKYLHELIEMAAAAAIVGSGG